MLQGKLVWSWIVLEYFDEFGFIVDQLKWVWVSENFDYLYINNFVLFGENCWYVVGDWCFVLDNLLFDLCNVNFIVIVDKVSGKVVWCFGLNFLLIDLKSVCKLLCLVDQISGQYDVYFIFEGLLGVGNLLVFDNQGDVGYFLVQCGLVFGLWVLEIDLLKKQIVW